MQYKNLYKVNYKKIIIKNNNTNLNKYDRIVENFIK
jgi:hypothetical protein